MDVVNVVGSGSLDVEIELSQLVDDLDSSIADYDPDKYPGVYLRFSDDTPLITIYRTGKYIVTGAESREQAHRYRDRFLNLLTEMGVTSDTSNTSFTIQNYVFVADLEKARTWKLSQSASGSSKQNTSQNNSPASLPPHRRKLCTAYLRLR